MASTAAGSRAEARWSRPVAANAFPVGGSPTSEVGSDVPLVVLVVDPATLDVPLPPAPTYDFSLPGPPGEGDSVDEAWALSNCRSCATQAVAFQVVLVVGTADVWPRRTSPSP